LGVLLPRSQRFAEGCRLSDRTPIKQAVHVHLAANATTL